jgi:hypothetical protein
MVGVYTILNWGMASAILSWYTQIPASVNFRLCENFVDKSSFVSFLLRLDYDVEKLVMW